MKFRAVLQGVSGLERPVQLLAQTLDGVEAWAKDTLAKYSDRDPQTGRPLHPRACVRLYEMKEVLQWTRRPADYK